MKLGLKLFSINENYVKDAVKLFDEGVYDFIELYVVPDSFNACINLWKPLNIPFIIHAPHFRHGVNLAKFEQLNENTKKVQEAQKFADELNAEYIIFHPGIAGDIKETARQLNIIDDARILIENKPYFTVLNDGNICNGNSPEEIGFILENTTAGFCLDIGHCFCSANAKNIEPFEYLKEFLKFNPKMFHLTDNDFSSPIDKHLHFGEGNFDIEKIINLLPVNTRITLETDKNSRENLDDFVEDVEYIRKFNYVTAKATENDLMDVFNLSNDRTVRENSFNSDAIKLDDHKKWFKNKINNEDCFFYIIRKIQNNELIAYVRFEKSESDSFIAGIAISPKYRGKNYGKNLLISLSSDLISNNPVSKIYAHIKVDNKASFKVFQEAGYVLTESNQEKYVLEYKI